MQSSNKLKVVLKSDPPGLKRHLADKETSLHQLEKLVSVANKLYAMNLSITLKYVEDRHVFQFKCLSQKV